MKKLKSLIFLLFILYFSSGLSQDCQTITNFADYKYLDGDFETCVKEYQRSLLFTPDSGKAYLQRQLGKCFSEIRDFNRAHEFFLLAETYFKDDSLKLECKFDGLASLIQNGDYFAAINELISIPDSTNSYFKNRKMFYLGICNWYIGRYADAFPFFMAVIPEQEVQKRQSLLLLQKRITSIGHPYPKLAFILNIIPGIGQIYAGDLKQGLNSFFLSTGLFYTGIISLQVLRSDLAFLFLLPWIQRYYLGGMILARDLAEKKQSDKRNLVFLNILDLLE